MKKLFLSLLLLLAAAPGLLAQPAQIIVIRHGEKPSDPEELHLSSAGKKRAKALVAYVKKTPELTQHGLPAALFATETTKNGHGQRTAETLQPLAKELKLPIQAPWKSDEASNLAQAILRNEDYKGKTVLICWTHEHIPILIKALGIDPAPPKLGDNVYDRVYLIDYGNGKPCLRELRQTMPSEPEKDHPSKEPKPRKKHKHLE